MKCSELDLRPEILKALEKMGYEELTPIQSQTLEPILAGRDMIARAETGSGKTAACAIPIVQKVDPEVNAIQALILVPTRELALQYVEEIGKITKYSKVKAFAVYGGFNMEIQKGKLADGVHVLVATPGRLIDMLYNTDLTLSEVSSFILDEADEMLNMGFICDVEFILSCLIHEHQSLLFSATMPNEIKKLSEKYLTDPVLIELNIDQVAPTSLSHRFQKVKSNKKLEILLEYFEKEDPKQAIIFCNSRRNCLDVYDKIKKKLKSVESIHGGMEQAKRTSLFRKFKKMNVRFMVATDIAGRGLDFSHVSHVINYDFPMDPKDYTHRTGRTARMGREGAALTFFSTRELGKLRRLLHANHIEPEWIGEKPNLSKARRKKTSKHHKHKIHSNRKNEQNSKKAKPRKHRKKIKKKSE